MFKKTGIAVIVGAAIFAVLLSSCFTLLAGGAMRREAGADRVKALLDSFCAGVSRAGLGVAQAMVGTVDMAGETTGVIQSAPEGNNSAVHSLNQTGKVVEITVSARKSATPQVQFARNIWLIK